MREPFEEDREDFAVGERFDRESTEAEALEAIEIGAEEELDEQERILAASRAVRAGTDMLFAALRKNGVL